MGDKGVDNGIDIIPDNRLTALEAIGLHEFLLASWISAARSGRSRAGYAEITR
jgi:hypothetical protein